MDQTLQGIRRASPTPVVRFDTTAVATQKIERYQRTILVDASSGANKLTVILPPVGEAEGDIFSVRVAGSTGNVTVKDSVTSWAISAGTVTETMMFISDGYEYRVVEDNAD